MSLQNKYIRDEKHNGFPLSLHLQKCGDPKNLSQPKCKCIDEQSYSK